MAVAPLENLLPADLPEDWQAEQIIAPTGEEVGLSHQHGYNYLMEMVNRTQMGVNQINETLADGVGGGFVEMEESIPVSDRADDTLYGLIIESFD